MNGCPQNSSSNEKETNSVYLSTFSHCVVNFRYLLLTLSSHNLHCRDKILLQAPFSLQAKLETKALKAKRPGFTDERYNETSYYYDPENSKLVQTARALNGSGRANTKNIVNRNGLTTTVLRDPYNIPGPGKVLTPDSTETLTCDKVSVRTRCPFLAQEVVCLEHANFRCHVPIAV